jgi:hypothetical protein
MTNVLPSLSNIVTALANIRQLRVANCGRVRGGSRQGEGKEKGKWKGKSKGIYQHRLFPRFLLLLEVLTPWYGDVSSTSQTNDVVDWCFLLD